MARLTDPALILAAVETLPTIALLAKEAKASLAPVAALNIPDVVEEMAEAVRAEVNTLPENAVRAVPPPFDIAEKTPRPSVALRAAAPAAKCATI